MNESVDNASVRKILVFKFGGVGDYAILLPFLEDLKNLYPDASITAVSSPSGRQLLEHGGFVDKTIISTALYKQGMESVLSLEAFRDLFRIRREMEAPYDMFIDVVSKYSFGGILKPLVLKLLSRPKYSIGLDAGGKAFYLDERIPDNRYEKKHNIEKYGEILKKLGAKPVFHTALIKPSHCALNKANDFFLPFEGYPRIGLHPGANAKYFDSRAWPVERFAELAEKIKTMNPSARIFATSGPHEDELVKRLESLARSELIPVPLTENIIDFCAFLSKFDFYISSDTGPMHLAVAMGIPTIGIFGHADYESYGTYPPELHFSAMTLEKGRKYGPSPSIKDPRGLLEISADDVFSKYLELKNRCGK